MVSVANELKGVVIGYASNPQIFCEFGYTGAEQCIALPRGMYCLEVWGAQGGYSGTCSCGGMGGYSGGCITLNSDTAVYIYVGGTGSDTTSSTSGGWNGGGGACSSGPSATGGGGTDIRIGGSSLYHRRIVAGGGGGGTSSYCGGGAGGGCTGCPGTSWSGYAYGLGGTQTSAGGVGGNTSLGGCCPGLNNGVGFGTGGRGIGSGNGGGGGGGGWYGGGGGGISGGGGGSGYVYNSSTCGNAPSGYCHCTDYFLTNAYTCDGNTTFPSPDGSTETGHSGNGCVKISSV